MKEPVFQESPGVSPREARRRFCAKRFRTGDLCIAGLLMTAAFLCNPSTLLRTFQFLIFWFYAWLTGKKNNPLFTLAVMLGIVLFNLPVPYGKVIAEWGVFRITRGSLLGGIHKAVTLEGLIMLSKASIRPQLRLPGSFGSLLGESLRVFERIVDRKSLISRKRFIEGIDELMLELSAEQEEQPVEEHEIEPPRTVAAMLLLAGAVVPVPVLTVIALIFGSL